MINQVKIKISQLQQSLIHSQMVISKYTKKYLKTMYRLNSDLKLKKQRKNSWLIVYDHSYFC
jgi:hypothetical protein